jgi:tetratricopeptide (TPR) repeat protein
MSSQSGGMRYQDFTLQVVPRLAGRYVVYAQGRQGEGKGPFTPPPAWRREGAPASPRDVKPQPQRASGSATGGGDRLFEALFPPEVLRLYERSLQQAQASPETGLRLKLMLDPSDPDLAGLLDLPWEDLRQPGTPDFLALSRRHSIVRYLMVPRPVPAATRPPVLRILTLAASPRGLPPLDLDRERRNVAAALQKAAGIELVDVAAPTPEDLRRALLAGECHGFHFMGHGGFDAKAGGGALYFETKNGEAQAVSGEELANILGGFPSLRLVVLNACKSARSSEDAGNPVDNPFGGVAPALVLGGLPAVIAMRSAISDPAAIAFSETFYQRLALGDPVDAVMVEGRQAIYAAADSAAKERAEWATPALFMRTKAGELFPAEDLPPEEYPKRPWWPGWVAAALLLIVLGGVVWLLSVQGLARDGSRFLQQNRPDEAREAFSKALVLAPYSPDSHLGMALAESLLGQGPAAEEHYLRAVQLKPHDPKYRFHWGAFLNLRGRSAEAARELAKAIAEDRTYLPAYNELARSEIGQGLWSAARDTLNAGLKYAGADPVLSPAPLYDKLGQVDLHQERIEDAIVHLKAALDYPQERDGQLNTIASLAEAYARRGDMRRVCGSIQKFYLLDRQGVSESALKVQRLAGQHGCRPDFDGEEKK